MRRFVFQFTGFLALQLAVVCLLFAVCCAIYPPSESYLAALLDKRRLLATQSEPRLVIVGDSSAAFGLDSGLIAHRVGRRPVNLGLMAALDIQWTLRDAEAGLRSGDVVLVQFTPVKFMESLPSADNLLRLLTVDPQSIHSWGWPHFKDALERGAHLYLARIATTGRRILLSPRTVPEDGDREVLLRINLNANGDMVGHASLPSRWNAAGVRPFVFDEHKAVYSVSAVRAFSERCRARGVTVFLVSAPVPQGLWNLSGEEIEKLHRWMVAQTGLASLNEPAANVWPDGEFFDTQTHPGKALAGKHSKILAARLEAVLAGGVIR